MPTKKPAAPEEILSKPLPTVFAPKAIHESYRAFLKFFEGPLSEKKILQGAYMTYGWMPTMLRIKGPLQNLRNLAVAARAGKVTEYHLGLATKTLNNSLVGTSKLLHFLAPETYPIWDSRVYRALYQEKPHRYRVESTKTYMEYLQWITTLESALGFREAKIYIEAEAGYKVTNKRAAELILFALGKPTNKKK